MNSPPPSDFNWARALRRALAIAASLVLGELALAILIVAPQDWLWGALAFAGWFPYHGAAILAYSLIAAAVLDACGVRRFLIALGWALLPPALALGAWALREQQIVAGNLARLDEAQAWSARGERVRAGELSFVVTELASLEHAWQDEPAERHAGPGHRFLRAFESHRIVQGYESLTSQDRAALITLLAQACTRDASCEETSPYSRIEARLAWDHARPGALRSAYGQCASPACELHFHTLLIEHGARALCPEGRLMPSDAEALATILDEPHLAWWNSKQARPDQWPSCDPRARPAQPLD